MIEAIIFDFYGVLYSNFNWVAIDARIYTDVQKSISFRASMKKANLGEISNEEFLRSTSALADDANHPKDRAVNFESSLNFSALNLIESLNPNYKIGLLSNGSRVHIKEVLEGAGGEGKYFDAVISSSESKHGKPAARAFLDILERLGVRPQTALMIDDSPGHIAGAAAAGLRTIHFSDMENLRKELQDAGVECA